MLMTEWNMDDAIAVNREEAWEEGLERGLEEGRAEGREEGQRENTLEIARNLLAEGATSEFIQKITGLDIETITSL